MATAGGGRGVGPERAWAPSLPPEGPISLDAEESAHLVRSRRVGEGDPVVLFDGRGASVLGRLVRADPRGAVVEIEGTYPDREPARSIRIALSPPEAGRADGVVSQLAQLGVSTLAWLRTERTPAGREALPARRAERWRRLVIEAAKVNGRSRCLEVAAEAVSLGSFLDSRAAILLDPDPVLPPLPDLLAPEMELPWVLVGPEGGFTEAELEDAARKGARRARLGTTALRTETAVVVAGGVMGVVA